MAAEPVAQGCNRRECPGTRLSRNARNPAPNEAFPGAQPHAAVLQRKQLMIKKVLLALAAGSIVLSASACNTVRGAGQDLESAANEVDEEI